MIRSILVPLDGSEFAARALPLAVGIAQSADAKLELVHVHDRPVQLLGAPPNDLRFDVEMERLMGRELEQTAERLRADTRLRIEATLLEGPVVEAIRQHIAGTQPSLVVMTSHRQGGLRRMVTGSVADALAREADVPVLIERGTGDAPPPKPSIGESIFSHILLPLDGSRLAEDIVGYAVELGKPRGTTFTLLRIVVPIPMFVMPAPTPPMPDDDSAVARSRSEALAQFDRVACMLKQHGFLVTPQVVVHSQPADAILAFAAEHPTDLIALSTHGHGGFARAILGSVADKVTREADVAILLHTSSSTALEEESRL